jgi:hypothetical protein
VVNATGQEISLWTLSVMVCASSLLSYITRPVK